MSELYNLWINSIVTVFGSIFVNKQVWRPTRTCLITKWLYYYLLYVRLLLSEFKVKAEKYSFVLLNEYLNTLTVG